MEQLFLEFSVEKYAPCLIVYLTTNVYTIEKCAIIPKVGLWTGVHMLALLM